MHCLIEGPMQTITCIFILVQNFFNLLAIYGLLIFGGLDHDLESGSNKVHEACRNFFFSGLLIFGGYLPPKKIVYHHFTPFPLDVLDCDHTFKDNKNPVLCESLCLSCNIFKKHNLLLLTSI